MSKSSESIRKPLIGFTLFAVFALVLTYVIWSTLERSVSGTTDTFSTTFSDASGLAKGDDVRMAGVRVGRVDDIKLDKSRARVTFEVMKDQKVLANTKAAIRYQNLIGQRYLALSLVEGKPSTPLAAGSSLRETSEDSFDVTALLAGFQPVFETLQPDQVNSLSEGLIQAFQGNSVSLSTTVAEVGQVASDMANRDAVLTAIINNLSGVMRDLSAQGGQIGTVIDSVGNLIQKLNGNSATFGASVRDIGRTAAGFADVLAQNRSSLASAATDTRVATRTLIGQGPKLDGMARNLPIFLAHLPIVLGQGSYLNIYACDLDIAFGDVLLPPGLINKIGGTRHSVVCQ